MSKTDAILETAEKSGVTAEIYKDLIQPAAREAGKALAFPFELVNALLVNPRKWIANANYELSETTALIANKLRYIDENKLIAPPQYVAVPALQALSYSMDNEDLRNLYANLLAKAMNVDTSATVHPAYVEIIKQFSPLDARLYKHIVENLIKNDNLPLWNIVFKSDDQIVKKYKNVAEYQDAELSYVAQSVDNFIRCGLISVSANTIALFKGGEKNEVMQWKNVQSVISKGVEMELNLCTPAHITELGKKFYAICCSD